MPQNKEGSSRRFLLKLSYIGATIIIVGHIKTKINNYNSYRKIHLPNFLYVIVKNTT